MTSPSNLYAEKVFAEHPLALWALDDKADYISTIPDSFRDLSNAEWTVSNGTASTNTLVSDEPFPDTFTTTLTGDGSGQIVAISPEITNVNILSPDLATMAIGLYAYSDSVYISGFEIGYEYDSGLDVIQVLKTFNTSVTDSWLFLSETFDIPQSGTDFRIVIKINYITLGTPPGDYVFYINGLSVGQWSEEFHSSSLGVETISFPGDIAISQSTAVVASAYGLQENNAYYLTKENALVARNSGIPMVYGAADVTLLSANSDSKPSLIIPGLGCLNEAGRYKTYTVEMWMRINAGSAEERRIFGPISSQDGLYVEGAFLTLKIGGRSGSHFVGEWFRPMLLDLRVSPNSASVLLNAEEVISFELDQSTLELPEEYSLSDKSQDWLGFYAYDDVTPIGVDAVAIYSYLVPLVVAKRRWIYGQGVELPENINTAYSGTSTLIDYAFADYTNSYSYPDLGRWSQGAKEGFSTNNNRLSFSNYQLPDVYLNNKTYEELITECNTIDNPLGDVITLKPEGWTDTHGYLLFDRLNILDEKTAAIYGLFEEDTPPSTEEILFKLENPATGNYLKICSLDDSVLYKFYYNGVEETIYSTTKNPGSDIILAGIDIKKFSSNFGRNVSSFLGNPSQIKVYVAGSKDLDQTYSGYIHNVSFSTERNLVDISGWFDSTGVLQNYQDLFDAYSIGPIADAGDEYFGNDSDYWEILWDAEFPETFPTEPITEYVASYTMLPQKRFGSLVLDISTDSYWEDYQPLSYFAQFVKDAEDNSFYDLDFIQFNVDYPTPTSIVDGVYDTSESIIKTYISFKYTNVGVSSTKTSFTNTVPLSTNNVVEPGEEWLYTKYEVIDGAIIYPPGNTGFEGLAIMVHIEAKPNAILSQPVSIRSLKLASQAFNKYSSNPIGTRFGTPIYPYKKSGVYFDYKSRNPFSIYKGSSPYLYLTKNSGIRQVGDYDPLVDRGLSIPINQGLSSNFNVIAMQMAVRYSEPVFPSSEKQIFEVQSNNAYLKFYIVSTHPTGKRGKIYAKNTITGQLENGIAFYWNGKIVKEPELTIDEWGMLGFSFANNLNFDNNAGALRINGPILVNTITHYESTNLQEVQNVSIRPWFKAKFLGTSELDWQFWANAYLWSGVLVLSSTSYYGVNPSDIYKTYTGTNKFIIDDERDLRFGQYEYNTYKDISWQSATVRPA
jgi:hypothetical protein